MDILIWIGAAISALGLAGILWCMGAVFRAKKAGLDDAALRDRLARVVPVNLGALFVSVIGLMLIVVGIMLR